MKKCSIDGWLTSLYTLNTYGLFKFSTSWKAVVNWLARPYRLPSTTRTKLMLCELVVFRMPLNQNMNKNWKIPRNSIFFLSLLLSLRWLISLDNVLWNQHDLVNMNIQMQFIYEPSVCMLLNQDWQTYYYESSTMSPSKIILFFLGQ